MTTRLDRPLKRELSISGEAYTLTVSPEGLQLARKGRRKGQELRWADLVSGDAALATALNASLARASAGPERREAVGSRSAARAPGRTPRKRAVASSQRKRGR